MPRPLTEAEIEALASRKGVRANAVRNFLGSLPVELRSYENRANLQADARSYRWNAVTVNAIAAGITKAYK